MTATNDARRIGLKIDRKADRLVRGLVLETTGRLVKRTPVLTGRARANWQVGTKPAKKGGTDKKDRGGSATIAGAARAARQLANAARIFITNGLPYIAALDKGSSSQAPNGMVSTTLAELKAITRKIARSLRNV